MADINKKVDLENHLSLAKDLLGVLDNRTDGDVLAQVLCLKTAACNSSEADSREVQSLVEDYQKKVDACIEQLEKIRTSTISDDDFNRLQHELQEKLEEEGFLRQELRKLKDDFADLECQMASMEEKKEAIKRSEKETSRAEDSLSMYVSVTSIIPDMDDPSRTSGYIVGKNKRAKKFNFENLSEFEVSYRLWKLI